MKFGKLPAKYDRRDLRLEDYLITLPGIPTHFGHEALITDWKMLGNDTVGDCVLAAGAHETMLWKAEAGSTVLFSDASVLSDYSAITGYNPNDPSTDQGTDMRAALNYRRKTGLKDAHGTRHKIGAYVALEPGNHSHLYAALYIFGAVEIGIQVPGSAMDQFNAGKPWSVVSGSPIEGGHDVPLVAKRTRLECVTWGRIQQMTVGFLTRYMDEAYAILSPEMLVAGKSLEGFDLASLQADLARL